MGSRTFRRKMKPDGMALWTMIRAGEINRVIESSSLAIVVYLMAIATALMTIVHILLPLDRKSVV